MSAPPPSSLPQASPATLAGEAPASRAEIDASCRLPLLLLFLSSLLWLLLGTSLALLTSMQLHSPEFLAHCPCLTYGRLHPAALNALVYGFASQAGLGVALWLICRLGRTPLPQPLVVVLAAKFWNFGVTLGVLGILAGDSTGFDLLEMPRYAAPILFVSYAVIGVWALITFHFRRERELYVSQWYLLAGLIWFPWIYSTANYLLLFRPVRGVMQTVVNGWYAHNLHTLWLTPVGLATAIYFIPKLLGRPLHSRQLALLGFWSLALFGAWGGIAAGSPLPAWIISVSAGAALMLSIPVLAVVTNLCLTVEKSWSQLNRDRTLTFMVAGVIFYFLGSVLDLLGSVRPLNTLVRFTHYQSGVTHLLLYGFFALTMFGAIYYIVPRLAGQDWPSAILAKVHLVASVLGVALHAVALIAGGIWQGMALDSGGSFLAVAKSTSLFLQLATVANFLLVAGQVALLLNLAQLLRRACAACGNLSAWCAGDAETKNAEVDR